MNEDDPESDFYRRLEQNEQDLIMVLLIYFVLALIAILLILVDCYLN